jgi:exonuclease VII small subunit
MANIKEIITALEQEKERLETAIHALNGRPKNLRRKGKKTMSAAARKRISIAQKRRWKAQKAKAKA